MKIQLLRTRNGTFAPVTEQDVQALSSIHEGDHIYGDFRQSRHPEHHKKAFVMLREIFDNQDQIADFSQFYIWMKIAAGAVDTLIGADGNTYYIPQSLAFASMDQSRFSEVYEAFKTVAVERLGFDWVLTRY